MNQENQQQADPNYVTPETQPRTYEDMGFNEVQPRPGMRVHSVDSINNTVYYEAIQPSPDLWEVTIEFTEPPVNVWTTSQAPPLRKQAVLYVLALSYGEAVNKATSRSYVECVYGNFKSISVRHVTSEVIQ